MVDCIEVSSFVGEKEEECSISTSFAEKLECRARVCEVDIICHEELSMRDIQQVLPPAFNLLVPASISYLALFCSSICLQKC